MIFGQLNSLLRRVSFTMRDLDGLLANAPLINSDVQVSLNGGALGAATGTANAVGSGAFYYGGTLTDASTYGALILVISHTGYVTSIVEEPVTDTGFGYIALNEEDDTRARVFFVIEDISGNPTPGLAPSGAQVKIGNDGGVLSTALGPVVGVGAGVYYYQTTPGDRSIEGDIILVVNMDNDVTYKTVVARKLVMQAANPLPVPPPQVATGKPPPDLTNLSGWDISMVGGKFGVTPSGDWALLDGVPCAQQSVTRELLHNKRSFPRRPEWGGDLPSLVLKGNTKANRDKAISQSRAALLRNPRIKKINKITTALLEAPAAGFSIEVDADAVDGRITPSIPVTPVRNQ